MDKQMLDTLCNILFIIAPAIGYLPQILSRNVVFSPLLSLMLILSCVLKFYYRKIESFENIILYQSLALFITQLILIYNFKHKLGIVEERLYNIRKNNGVFAINISLLSTVVLMLNLTTFLKDPTLVYKICGVFCFVLESSVGLVQILMKRLENRYVIEHNEKRRLPKELFMCWIIGDIAKLFWMMRYNSPMLLTVPIVFQIIVDIFLMFE